MIAVNKILRLIKKLFFHDKWNIGYLYQTPRDLIESKKFNGVIKWLEEDNADYAADPFVTVINGKFHIYYEELNFLKGKGELMLLDELHFSCKKKVRGINNPVHISYPYLFMVQDELYCIPETAAVRQIALYKINCEDPGNLKKVRIILEGYAFVDSSIIYFNNKYWLFTSISGKKGQLFIYSANSLEDIFKPHILNPIITGAKHNRSAGGLFIIDGKLYMPTQNPEKCYGGSVVITEITHLTDTEFQFCPLFELMPQKPYDKGLHTINFAGGLLVVDGKREVFNLISPLKKVLKRVRA